MVTVNRISRTTLNSQTVVTTDKSDGVKEYSFVQDDLRPYAMKLHTKDQAPKEGKEAAKVPFTQWNYGRADYLRFLVDSLTVYETFDKIVASNPALASLQNTGLERSAALKEDIQWMVKTDPTLTVPECGESGREYAKLLEKLAAESIPKFLCHYYNHYFAHTAGGRMIGKKVAEKILDNATLKFYEWDSDVKVRASLDISFEYEILPITILIAEESIYSNRM
jgi:heme oxygenase